jgi:hypothetical protein
MCIILNLVAKTKENMRIPYFFCKQILPTYENSLTGAKGYAGKRILIFLIVHCHEITCCVRDKNMSDS